MARSVLKERVGFAMATKTARFASSCLRSLSFPINPMPNPSSLPPDIRAVAFDMDGLMFNTEDLYDQVGAILLKRRGRVFSRDLKLMMMGLPGSSAFEIMIDHCRLTDSAVELQKEADEIFDDLLPAEIIMMPGLEELLATLEQRKIPKAVATSSHRRFARRALGRFDLEPRFEFILTSEDVTNGKPHPEIYLAAAQRLHVQARQMLVLEDSFFGTQAAVEAGAFTIAVPTVHSVDVDFGHVNHVATSLRDPVIFNCLASRNELA